MILAPNGKPARSELRAQGMGYAFDAAKRSGYRGWFWFPELDPRSQMPEWTRAEIAGKVNWLYNNNGAATLVVDGLSLDEVDTGIWPRATTSSAAFNKEVTNAFDDECGDARFFDEAAVENFYTMQYAIRRHIRLHGEFFGQLLRPGEGSNLPTLHTVTGFQVGQARTQQDQSAWDEGVMSNARSRAIMYRFLTNKDRTQWQDVPAGDVLHFHDAFWKGQKRGVSLLANAARKLFSMDDIERANTSGELLRTRIAYAITKKDDGDGEPAWLPGASAAEIVETEQPDGKKVKLLIQRIVANDGSEVDVADLPPGRDLKVVESQKGSAAKEWNQYLLTDVAYGTLYPPEYVFFLGGIGQGTLARLVQKRVQRVKNTVRHFQLIPQFCKRWYNFWLWQRIKMRRFDAVGVPADWFRARMICPADDTVDQGREGRLYDDRVGRGNMSPEVYHGMQGEDADSMEDEVIAARIRRLKKLKDARDSNPDIADELGFDEVFRPPAGTPAESAASAPDEEEEIDPSRKKEGKNGSRMHSLV